MGLPYATDSGMRDAAGVSPPSHHVDPKLRQCDRDQGSCGDYFRSRAASVLGTHYRSLAVLHQRKMMIDC
jgi:hypothetical protein